MADSEFPRQEFSGQAFPRQEPPRQANYRPGLRRTFRRLGLLAALWPGLVLLEPAADGQVAEQVIDLVQEGLIEVDIGDSSYPENFTPVADRVLFFAYSDSMGREPWISDSTKAGTSMLVDSCPGRCSYSRTYEGRLGDLFFWVSKTAPWPSPFETLWRSDGTRAGTFSLTSTTDQNFTYGPAGQVFGDALIFSRFDDEGHSSLWRTDGTVRGTHQLVEFATNGDFPLSRRMVILGDHFYFLQGGHLWSSDGTEAGTAREADLTHFTDFNYAFRVVGDRLLFATEDPGGETILSFEPSTGELRTVQDFRDGEGLELGCLGVSDSAPGKLFFHTLDDEGQGALWQLEATQSSPQLVAQVGNYGPFVSQILCPSSRTVQAFGETLVFLATANGNPVLLAVDSQSGGEEAPTAVCSPDNSCSPEGDSMSRIGDRVLFSASHPDSGLEVWSTDGTLSGTEPLLDLCEGPCDSYPGRARESQGHYYIQGYDLQNQQGLWRTDGTAEGTHRALTLPLGVGVSFSNMDFARLGNLFLFRASSQQSGFEPWVSTDPQNAPQLLVDIEKGSLESKVDSITPSAEGVVFSAITIHHFGEELQRNLWSSSGTAADTIQLTTFTDLRELEHITAAGDLVFFDRETDEPGREVFRSDGTPEGTFPVHLFNASGPESPITLSRVFPLARGQRYFLASGRTDGGLWQTDGATAQLAVDFASLGISGHQGTWPADERLYFTAETSPPGSEPPETGLFATDGSLEGTQLLTATDPLERIAGFGTLGDDTFFLKGDCPGGSDLWRSRGTSDTTQRLDLGHRFACTAPELEMVRFRGDLYFVEGKVEESGRESGLFLWRTDGTAAGTQPVVELSPETASQDAPGSPRLTATTSALFLTTTTPGGARNLWVSDGTTGGSMVLRTFSQEELSSGVGGLTAAGDRLFFAADNDIHGRELWTSDGTAAGTHLVHDINPEGLSSNPRELTVAGDELYFSASDGPSGQELWRLPLASNAPACRASSTALCLLGERFKVEMGWSRGNRRVTIGASRGVPMTENTGYFWSLQDQDVETVVKIIDGQGVNGHHWFFFGDLSDSPYRLTVTDTQTGLTRRYKNRGRHPTSFADVEAFGPRGANLSQPSPPLEVQETAQPIILDRRAAATSLEGCSPSATRLCLNEGRFAAEATWTDFSGNSGEGQAVALSGETGYFWFFNDKNVEAVLKVIDGRPANGAFWVFYGSLTNVDFDLTVTDTQTGAVRAYQNRGRQFRSVGDKEAFPE
ncbi:MAG: hypothetical protein K0U98_15655 [Deltaproteobacteria bacterium]|nr:hypothetical protein [Deltaproteobacteria bacterium]